MNRKERFEKSYEYLRSKGCFHTQKDAAEKMKTTQQNMSAALKGNEKVLTDNFIIRFCAAFDGIINSEWIMEGTGTMLIGDVNGGNNAIGEKSQVFVHGDENIGKLIEEMAAQRETFQMQINHLLKIIDKLTQK